MAETRAQRLRRTDSSSRGYTRVRAGSGFSYRDPKGVTVTDPELRARFDALGIPPAWKDVWIAPYPNGHIQAMGVDAAGRRQYIYHPTWREQKDRIKFDRALRLAESLPSARRAVTMDLRRDGYGRERALATAFRMLDTGSLRVGSERYAKEHGSIGLSTLLCSHATTHGDRVALAFPGKSHQAWTSEILDHDLASVVRSLKRRGPNARLLAWKDGREWRPLSAPEINDYVREKAGDDFTAKDFRTLHGTVAAALSLARTGPKPTQRARNSAIAQAMRDASEVLGNTPTVARASYVDPRVLDHYRAGETIDPARPNSAETTLRALLYE
ncbi:DNA topoisomerase IB [Rathayibacter caricis DSM 15933]|jgi:DNA topoisomerase-1|uniref:DNA topoisomerase n=1 Tax=Rathayibacter caricis DSM 15933 TaxID=1328867 RepID=A0A2T4UU27_9MICO|nr:MULTISPECIES: DNA topoisomerase IB [Rathayibacter]KQQ22462.1 DNA topoisomerase [Rathayibacter sp. Leaf299]MCJ1695392.1 DNA topoisomerase IB [Rathayibacter caricis]PTL73027.1 DNA topoisomerase IB [Rathayibacter caricis DSM 15933]